MELRSALNRSVQRMSSEIEDLERLIALRDAGEIDEEEFNTLKQQLLSAGSSAEQSSDERKQIVGLAVVVTLLSLWSSLRHL